MKKVRPEKDKNYKFNNDTLKDWFGFKNKSLDEVLKISYKNKVKGNVRVAYQYGIQVNFNETTDEAIPYTFEDAIALSNIELFKQIEKPTGMIKKMQYALSMKTLGECCDKLFEALKEDKAKMALDILFDIPPEKLAIPKYIEEGLSWLENELERVSQDFPSGPSGDSCCLDK